jgi:hypothetical protein
MTREFGFVRSNMDLKSLLLLCTTFYALHTLEEFIFDWRDWARAVLQLPVERSTFYVTNFASLCWASSVLALSIRHRQSPWPLPR